MEKTETKREKKYWFNLQTKKIHAFPLIGNDDKGAAKLPVSVYL